MAHYVADLDELREHFGYERWFVVGHSFGATLGLALARVVPACFGHGLSHRLIIELDLSEFGVGDVGVRVEILRRRHEPNQEPFGAR
jgi:hypothetical protein